MEFFKKVKNNQEQAVAAWINYLNQVRLDELTVALRNQDENLDFAMNTLTKTLSVIKENIIERNRGGDKGMHGFIAEVAECGIGNAREHIKGKGNIYEWINDNGPDDLVRNGIRIQQKFVNSGGHLSLQAVKMHLEKYPDYLRNGGKYQIPSDHYERIQEYLSMSKEQAGKLPTSDGSFNKKQWQEVQEFFADKKISLNDIEPSKLSYREVQKGKIEETISHEKANIQTEDEKIRQAAYEKSKPSFNEGAKAIGASAVIEGGTTFVFSIIEKRKQGKRIKEFSYDDWMEILKGTGISTAKGSVRGLAIYSLTNFTATPAAVASSLCTASFGIAEQAHQYRIGAISEEDFLMNSEMLCLDVTVSAFSSFLGQALIPVPVLGAVIGNTVGMFIYNTGMNALDEKEKKLINQYIHELNELDKELDEKFYLYSKALSDYMNEYFGLLEKAFSPDISEALVGSYEIAISLGVASDELLKTVPDVDVFFLE